MFALVWGQEGCHCVEGVAGVAEARLFGSPAEEVESMTPGWKAEDDRFRGGRREMRGVGVGVGAEDGGTAAGSRNRSGAEWEVRR